MGMISLTPLPVFLFLESSMESSKKLFLEDQSLSQGIISGRPKSIFSSIRARLTIYGSRGANTTSTTIQFTLSHWFLVSNILTHPLDLLHLIFRKRKINLVHRYHVENVVSKICTLREESTSLIINHDNIIISYVNNKLSKQYKFLIYSDRTSHT